MLYSKKASLLLKNKGITMDAHNGTKLARVIKLNSLQFKLSFVNFHGMILKRRKNHRNRATKDKTFPFSLSPFLPFSFYCLLPSIDSPFLFSFCYKKINVRLFVNKFKFHKYEKNLVKMKI